MASSTKTFLCNPKSRLEVPKIDLYALQQTRLEAHVPVALRGLPCRSGRDRAWGGAPNGGRPRRAGPMDHVGQ